MDSRFRWVNVVVRALDRLYVKDMITIQEGARSLRGRVIASTVSTPQVLFFEREKLRCCSICVMLFRIMPKVSKPRIQCAIGLAMADGTSSP